MIPNLKFLTLKILFSLPIGLLTLASNVIYASETVGLISPEQNQFYLKSANETGGAELTFVYGPPGAGWLPVMGDWDGDGIDTVGLFDPQANRFHLRNSNSAGGAELTFVYGPPGAGWLPVMGDWDGDGIDTVGLFDPQANRFHLRNSNSAGGAELTFVYGPPGAGWLPVMGDWDGDGIDTVGLFDPQANRFHLRNSNSAGGAELTFVYGPPGAGWLPVMGDWDGDGIDTVGLFDPQANRFHLRNSNSAGGAELTFVYGPPGAGWLPVTHQLTPSDVAEGGTIIDNGNTGFSSLGTNWTTSATAPGFFGENYQFAPAGDGSDSVSWTFQINSPGEYKIFAQWPALVSGTPEATYSIVNNDLTLGTVQRDQRISNGQFTELGVFELEVGSLVVVLQSSPSGAVAADAVFVGKGGLLQIVNPVENDLETNPSPTIKAVAINFPIGWGVEFVVKDFVTGGVVQTVSDFDVPFEQMAANLPLAKYIAEVHMVNQYGIRQPASDQHLFGIGDYYVGIGDSITYGTGDDILTDNMSNDGRNNSEGGGYTPILNNLLTVAKGYPHTVFNEGVPGDKSLDGVNAIDAVLAKHPNANFFLVQYGTNDSHNLRVPSGIGLSRDSSGYAGTFKDNMQQILDAIMASGKTPILAKLPITFGSSSRSEPFANPDSAERNLLIQEYNQVIGELISANGLPTTTPDFYSYFRENPSFMADNLHPDGLGYQGMAELWSKTLTGNGGP